MYGTLGYHGHSVHVLRTFLKYPVPVDGSSPPNHAVGDIHNYCLRGTPEGCYSVCSQENEIIFGLDGGGLIPVRVMNFSRFEETRGLHSSSYK